MARDREVALDDRPARPAAGRLRGRRRDLRGRLGVRVRLPRGGLPAGGDRRRRGRTACSARPRAGARRRPARGAGAGSRPPPHPRTRRPTLRVAVVIPARDAADTILETLESVRAQVHRDWEAVVVDDALDGRDGRRSSRGWPRGTARVRLMRNPGTRGRGARNAGAAATSAEWLCFLDADDQLLPGSPGAPRGRARARRLARRRPLRLGAADARRRPGARRRAPRARRRAKRPGRVPRGLDARAVSSRPRAHGTPGFASGRHHEIALGWAPGHFCSPIPDLAEVRRREARIDDRGRIPAGIDLRGDAQRALLDEIAPGYARLPWSSPGRRPPVRVAIEYYRHCDGVLVGCLLQDVRRRRYLDRVGVVDGGRPRRPRAPAGAAPDRLPRGLSRAASGQGSARRTAERRSSPSASRTSAGQRGAARRGRRGARGLAPRGQGRRGRQPSAAGGPASPGAGGLGARGRSAASRHSSRPARIRGSTPSPTRS